MSEQLLQQILDKLNNIESEHQNMKGEIQFLNSRQDETFQHVKAVRHAQELTNAKLEALTMDVHHVHGEATKHERLFDGIKNVLEAG